MPEKPVIETLEPARLPAELRGRAQWVAWRYEWVPDKKNGGLKRTKVPYRADAGALRRASATNPATWGSLGAALHALRAHGDLAGVGFVFSGDDPFVGVDLDKAYDPATGVLEAWASIIVERCASYTELSPSGTGVHILARGSLPPGGRKRGAVEMYEEGRYFTVTGRHLAGTPLRLEDRTEEVGAVHASVFWAPEPARPRLPEGGAPPPRGTLGDPDDAVLARAFRGKNGARVEALFHGEMERAGKGDHSGADLSLCSSLYFYSGGDRAQTDRVFRRSGLMRRKWLDRHHSDGRTYGQMTLDLVEATASSVYSPPRGGEGERARARHHAALQALRAAEPA